MAVLDHLKAFDSIDHPILINKLAGGIAKNRPGVNFLWLFLDLSKAFDSIDHLIIINKPKILHFTQNFLFP